MKDLLHKEGLNHSSANVYINSSQGLLVEHAVGFAQGKLTSDGALVVKSGKYTGRAAEDKYIVETSLTQKTIDWTNSVHKMSPAIFANLKSKVIEHLNKAPRIYASERNVGAVAEYSLKVQLFTAGPQHSLFFHHLLREDQHQSFGLGNVKIYHAHQLTDLPFKELGLRSTVVIATDIEAKEVIIIGTSYAGEIKKSVFSIMNYILPEKKILPMHAGSNTSESGNVSVFFGLSGTGKTTLSTQEGRPLIGDDEHALTPKEIFNFEGGCYAKMYKISAESEPGIFAASNRFGSMLENVVLNENNIPDFNDKTLAENTRSSYPLGFIKDFVKSGVGNVPKDLFFLSADAFGVLPPISRLTESQAMYYFLSGYTAKLAGTEVGVVAPKAAFSACFGAPFMIRPASEYATLLGQYLKDHPISVWLINTGWTGGKYGVGQRFPLKITRRLIEAVQNGEMNNAEFKIEEIFGLAIPTELKGVDKKYLDPRNTWTDSDAYKTTAQELATMFHKNFEKFQMTSLDIAKGSPAYKK